MKTVAEWRHWSGPVRRRSTLATGLAILTVALMTAACASSTHAISKPKVIHAHSGNTTGTTTTTTTQVVALTASEWLAANGTTLSALITDFYIPAPTGNQYGPTLVTQHCKKAVFDGHSLEEDHPLSNQTLQQQLSSALSTYVGAAQNCANDPDPLDTLGKTTETPANVALRAQGNSALLVVEQAIEAAAPGVVVPTPTITSTTVPPPIFTVTGTGPADITIDEGGQEVQNNEVSLPWSSNGPVTGPFFGFVSMDAQTEDGSDSATISCSILGGPPNTSGGPYSVVTCSGDG